MSQVEDNTDYIANDILNFTGINEPPQENRQNSFVRRFDDIAKTRDIFNTQVQINDILKMFNGKIGKLLQNHEKDFMLAYKDQMGQVQNELRILKNKIDEETLKQKNDEKLKILEEERDYFRAEAIRLDKLCKDQGQTIEECKFKITLAQEEKSFYEGFVIETKKENNALKTELINLYNQNPGGNEQNRVQQLKTAVSTKRSQEGAKRVHSQKGEKRSNYESTPAKQFFPTQVSLSDRAGGSKGVEVLGARILQMETTQKKNLEEIQHLKHQSEVEKAKLRKQQQSYSQLMSHRCELEEILLNCIEEVKKDIGKRKSSEKNRMDLVALGLQDFQATDKKKLLIAFLRDPKVLDSLYHLTFGVNDQNSQNNTLTKNWTFAVADVNNKYKQFKSTSQKLNLNRCIITKDYNSHDTRRNKQVIHQISNL